MKAREQELPCITVVMPAYNGDATITRAVASVQAQTIENWELIIVDDGSKDQTVERIHAISDPRIKLLVQPRNLGGNAARNRGIKEAQGDIISFLDCDDECRSQKLETIIRYFEGNRNVDAVIDSFELKYPTAKIAQRQNGALASNDAVREGIFNRTIYKATPALSARKQALLKVGLFDETLRRRQDMDLVLRLAKLCEIRTIPDVLWTKHWTPGAISSKQNTFMPALLDICERHPEYIEHQQFRKGLSRDFARHFLRLGLQLQLKRALVDWRQFNATGKSQKSGRLFAQGLQEIISRAVSRRNHAASSEPV